MLWLFSECHFFPVNPRKGDNCKRSGDHCGGGGTLPASVWITLPAHMWSCQPRAACVTVAGTGAFILICIMKLPGARSFHGWINVSTRETISETSVIPNLCLHNPHDWRLAGSKLHSMLEMCGFMLDPSATYKSCKTHTFWMKDI